MQDDGQRGDPSDLAELPCSSGTSTVASSCVSSGSSLVTNKYTRLAKQIQDLKLPTNVSSDESNAGEKPEIKLGNLKAKILAWNQQAVKVSPGSDASSGPNEPVDDPAQEDGDGSDSGIPDHAPCFCLFHFFGGSDLTYIHCFGEQT